jgi:hypothetical protein
MDKQKEIRKKHNDRLLDRMLNDSTDNLTDQIPMQDRFFPPRKIIKKNDYELEKIFGKPSDQDKP